MADGEEQPAGRDQVVPMSRIVVTLGRPAQGPGACRVESPERVVRMWELLNEADVNFIWRPCRRSPPVCDGRPKSLHHSRGQPVGHARATSGVPRTDGGPGGAANTPPGHVRPWDGS